MPRIVCVSDTHNFHGSIEVPDGDILVHSGDATISGTEAEVTHFAEWFGSLPHEHKVFIPGNHDWAFQLQYEKARRAFSSDITYLQDTESQIAGLNFYGTPWQPRFFDWAFNLDRGPALAEKWDLIPERTNVLITHGPPNGILDAVQTPNGGRHEGCSDLRIRVKRLAELGKLRLHIFGHIHSGYGTAQEFGIRFVNASSCNEEYRPVNPPIVIDL